MTILKAEQKLIQSKGGTITRVREGDGVSLTGNIVHFEYRGLECRAWGTDGNVYWIVNDPNRGGRGSPMRSFEDMAARAETILVSL